MHSGIFLEFSPFLASQFWIYYIICALRLSAARAGASSLRRERSMAHVASCCGTCRCVVVAAALAALNSARAQRLGAACDYLAIKWEVGAIAGRALSSRETELTPSLRVSSSYSPLKAARIVVICGFCLTHRQEA